MTRMRGKDRKTQRLRLRAPGTALRAERIKSGILDPIRLPESTVERSARNQFAKAPLTNKQTNSPAAGE